MSSNHVEVTSPEHFKELLSADLKRVSCLNFWAPWAEPCAAFNKDIEAAAAKYPSVLFLKVSRAVREDHMASFCITSERCRAIVPLIAMASNADLQIEAETLADISESFDIEAVPSVLLLRVSTGVCPGSLRSLRRLDYNPRNTCRATASRRLQALPSAPGHGGECSHSVSLRLSSRTA